MKICIINLFSTILLASLVFVSSTAYAADDGTVTGKILDSSGIPIAGANVIEKGETNGTITDVDGDFSLKLINPNAILVFSFIGFDSIELKASESMRVVLKESALLLDEIMVVGYGAQKKESVVGSIAQAKGEDLKSKGSVSNITDALSGVMPGVTVMTSNGNPGGGGEHGAESAILIRGMNTWNNASPLILVDGVERKMNDVDVNEIESFSVLKDASATAVFGVKGANGVILITTKRGKVGKAKVTAEINVAMKSISDFEQPVGAYEGLVGKNLAIVNELPIYGNDYWKYFSSNELLEKYRTQVDPEKYPNINWRDVMLRDQSYSSKYNVNISGGTNFVKYFTSLGYVHEGDILNSEGSAYSPEFRYDRFNFRTNLDLDLSPSTSIKINLSGYYAKQQEPDNGIHNMWYSLYKYDPAGAVPQYSDGTYGANYELSDRLGNNGYFYLMTDGTEVRNKTALTSDIELNQKLDFITKGLSLKGRFSYDNMFTSTGANIIDSGDNYIRKGWDEAIGDWIYREPSSGQDGFDFYPDPLGYAAEGKGTVNSKLYYEAALNYARKLGEHNISFLALFSREETTIGTNWTSKREDWVGRLTYDYMGKYLFEANGAYNGSEKFGPKRRFDFFPSLALGWRVTEESFIPKNDYLSNLKIKYSIGKVGNDNLNGVGMWPFLTTWDSLLDKHRPYFGSESYVQSQYPIYMEGTPGNPDLHWEVVTKQNLGIEFGLFKQMFSGTIDLFNDHRTDMLIAADQRTVPDTFGQTPPAANIGEVKSKGMEFEIKFNKRINEVELWGSYNWTYAKNEVIYKEDPLLTPFYQKAAGYSIRQRKSLLAEQGYIDSWDEMFTGVMNQNGSVNATMLPGAKRMIDYNGNGEIDDNDAAPNNYPTYPRNTYGFSFGAEYKGFSVNVNFYGAYNTTIAAPEFYSDFDFNSSCIYPSLLGGTWTPEYGVEDPTFRALSMNTSYPGGNEGWYDASFLRLKTVQLAYTVPKKISRLISIESIKFYMNGNNLLFWSDLPVDIEGKDFTLKSYPTTMQINFGTSITF